MQTLKPIDKRLNAINEFCINSHILLNQQTIITRNATSSGVKKETFAHFQHSIRKKYIQLHETIAAYFGGMRD